MRTLGDSRGASRLPKRTVLRLEQLETRRLLAINPTADEQEFLQLVNRFRTDPTGEFSRLIQRSSPILARDPDLQNDLEFFQVNGNVLRNELNATKPVPPLGWSEGTIAVAAEHNAKMVAQRRQFHSNSQARRQALLSEGVPLRFASGEKIHAENIFGFAKSPNHLFAAYVIDWGAGPSGMQSGRLHRVAIANSDFEQMGTKITSVGGSGFGPRVNTQVLVNIENPATMVIGALFEDRDNSNWYDAGEGIGGATIEFVGEAGTFSVRTFGAGGYQIELPAGTYSATATGGRLAFPVTIPRVVVGEENVWQNLIYDPDAPPPDRLENNNTLASATVVRDQDHSEFNLSIHQPSDLDHFKIIAPSTGNMTVTVDFSHNAGDLQLQLLNSNGGVIRASTGTNDGESISFNVTRGQTYFAKVFAAPGESNTNYSISVDLPEPQSPIAQPDQATVSSELMSTTINVLGNDIDPDGPHSALTVELAGDAPGFSVSGRQVVFQGRDLQPGMHRTPYSIVDDQQLRSPTTAIDVFFVDFNADKPWQNPALATDVNQDGLTSAVDVLLVINEINNASSRPLPTGGRGEAIFGFVDTSGDGSLSPLDALLPINALNAGNGEGEFAVEQPSFRTHSVDALMAVWFPVENEQTTRSDRFEKERLAQLLCPNPWES